nr:proline-rich receptor-like protein kinase PERK9 [Lolium perenne]
MYTAKALFAVRRDTNTWQRAPHDNSYEIKFGRFGIGTKTTTPGPSPTRTPPPPLSLASGRHAALPDVIEPRHRPLRYLPLHSPISLPCRSTPPSNLCVAARTPRTSLLQPVASNHDRMRAWWPELDLAPVSRPLLRLHPRSRCPYSGPVSGDPDPAPSAAPLLRPAPSPAPLLWPHPRRPCSGPSRRPYPGPGSFSPVRSVRSRIV